MSSLSRRSPARGPGLALQIFIFFVLPLTALLLLIAFSSQMLHQQAMRSLVGQRDGRTARLAAQSVDAQLARRSQAVSLLALNLADGVAPAALPLAAKALQADFEGGLAVFDAAGNPLAPQGKLASWDPTALQDVLSRAGPEPLFSTPPANSGAARPWVLIGVAAPDRRVVVGAFSPASLVEAALGNVLPPQSGVVVYVIDASRRPLYQSGLCSSSTPCTEHPAIAEAFQGQSGITYVQAPGGEHVVAFSPVSSTRWALVTEEPWEVVDTPGLRATQYAPLALLVPALILALVALWFGVRQIVQPLQALEAKAADLAWGQYAPIEQPVGGIAEIRRLQTELIHLAQKVKAAQQSLHSYIGAITSGQEEERRRLARELHDDTLQALIALNQRLQLASLARMEPATASTLAELQTLADQTIANLRRFTRALRPVYLEDLGLVTALEALAREVSQAGNVPIDFRQIGPERRLTPEVELALYRLAQEMLNNVIHHAQASQATLALAYSPENVMLTVSDAGCGFMVPDNPAEFAPSGHFGLLGMHERAELIGAQLDIRSAIGQGTQISVTLTG